LSTSYLSKKEVLSGNGARGFLVGREKMGKGSQDTRKSLLRRRLAEKQLYSFVVAKTGVVRRSMHRKTEPGSRTSLLTLWKKTSSLPLKNSHTGKGFFFRGKVPYLSLGRMGSIIN